MEYDILDVIAAEPREEEISKVFQEIDFAERPEVDDV
jgi:hypothetical protein